MWPTHDSVYDVILQTLMTCV